MDKLYGHMMKWFWYNHREKFDRFIESCSPNQIECKQWLVDELDNVVIPRDDNDKFKIEIVGGWFGFPLVDLLNKKFGDQIKEIDIIEADEFACRVIDKYVHLAELPFRVRSFHTDYFAYKDQRRAHMIINTSCEHMPDMINAKDHYITPERTLLVLQSNDKVNEPDHINCVFHTDDLVKQSGIKQLHGGTKKMNPSTSEKYRRFMVMGKWLTKEM